MSENLNNNVEYLNDNFTLIKSKNYAKPNSVYKLRHYSNVFWDKLKEENKDNSKILTLINVHENTNRSVTQLFDENIELKEKIENLEKAAEKTQKSLNEINDLLEKITSQFNTHKHYLDTFNSNIIGVGNISTQNLPLYSFRHFNNIIPLAPAFSPNNSLTIFDHEKINDLREGYLKIKKTSQN